MQPQPIPSSRSVMSLVSQIPALVVSVAAGLLVSKAGTEGSAEAALFDQLSRYPRAIWMTTGLLLFLGFMPGIPFLPFTILAGGGAWIAIRAQRKQALEAAIADAPDGQAPVIGMDGKPAPVAEEPISNTLAMDIIRLELGYGLLPLVQGEDSGKLTDQIKGLRRQLAEDMGYVLPAVRIQDNLQLPANSYSVRIKEIQSGAGEVRVGMLLWIPLADRLIYRGKIQLNQPLACPPCGLMKKRKKPTLKA